VSNRATDISTVSELHRFVATAAPGAVACYHSGNLAFDRDKSGPFKNDEEMYTQVDALAKAAWAFTEQKKLFLVQRRIEPGVCDYLAIRTAEGAASMRHDQTVAARDEEREVAA
jgi:hypothetical protein